jgi:pyrroloquinoline quinone biosynthesis protein D
VSALQLDSRPKLAAGSRLQTDRVTGEPVLLSPEGIQILNETALAILSRCDGVATVDQIAVALAEEYESEEPLHADVLECLAELHSRKLIVLA